MQKRDDLSTILPYLPLVFRSSSLLWPPSVEEALKAMSEGPIHSLVDSGEVLSLAISDMRQSLCFPSHPLVPSASKGYAIFFDELISKEDSTRWFGKVVPALANLLLRLPSLLETHYYYADNIVCGVRTGLRILGSQEAGIVYLSQELIGALLACSFFCLFPVTNRSVKKLPAINFDRLFACLHESYSENIESKIRCIVHYFERICSSLPLGVVSFERRVLSTENHHFLSAYPAADLWSKSALPLCPFEVHRSGLIEDQSGEAFEVDFANEYLGGGALHRGCLQEEIRFMINPELIAGMLFLPAMDDNEAIEIVGVERFSNYTGYASLFRFAGDFTDLRPKDSIGRRKTRIVAIDALCGIKTRQFKLKYLLREINKAFCGFLHHCNHSQHENKCHVKKLKESGNPNLSLIEAPLLRETPLSCFKTHQQQPVNQVVQNSDDRWTQCMDHQEKIGVATGNWGCGAFGGDPELKAMIQWLAASQAERPYVAYYTFGIAALQNLEQVTKWILYHEWTVGDLWNMLLEYSMQRFNEETGLNFFSWLLPTK